jgi:hypothetical protein
VRASDPRHLLQAYRDLVLLDRDDQPCGIVDDIEIAETEPGICQMTALLVGPGAWARRRPRWLTGLLPGHRLIRVEAADVASTGSAVRLLKKAEELGLAPLEQRWLQRLGTN